MQIVFDNTITVGQIISALLFIGGLIGIWLRMEKVLVRLDQRMVHAEARLDGHDYSLRANDTWRLNHLSDHHKSA